MKFIGLLRLVFAATLLTLPTIGHTAAETFMVGEGASATFEAIGRPSLLKIQGKGATVNGSVEIQDSLAPSSSATVTGEFQIELSKFTTGIETRDKHMKDTYLDVGKFPKSFLKVESVALPSDWKPGTEIKDATFKGTLTLKDVSKPVEGKVSIGREDMPAKADFVLKMSDYPSLGVPKYMGITVADAVVIQVNIPKFKRK